MKKYTYKENIPSVASEPAVAYASMHNPFIEISNIDVEDKHFFLGIIRKGVDFSVLQDFMRLADLHIDEMATILHINSRTIKRMSPSESMNTTISEKLIDLIRLYKLGHEVFGDTVVFNEWMRRKVAGIGYTRPIDYIDTSIGIQIIYDELLKLAHGVYS